METVEQRRERLRSAIWSKMDRICTEPCWTDKPSIMAGCVCISDAADAIIASDEAAGLVVVPKEPTDEMIDRGGREIALKIQHFGHAHTAAHYSSPEIELGNRKRAACAYRAMIAAAKE